MQNRKVHPAKAKLYTSKPVYGALAAVYRALEICSQFGCLLQDEPARQCLVKRLAGLPNAVVGAGGKRTGNESLVRPAAVAPSLKTCCGVAPEGQGNGIKRRKYLLRKNVLCTCAKRVT